MSSQCGLYKIYTDGIDKFGTYWLVLTDELFIYTHCFVIDMKWYCSSSYEFEKTALGNTQKLRSLL